MKPSSSRAKRTKSVPQTQQKRRKIILRDESDDEEVQVQPSEHVAKAAMEVAEKVSSQKVLETGSSRPLKRLRMINSDDKAPKVSPPLKKVKKQRANRDTVESIRNL